MNSKLVFLVVALFSVSLFLGYELQPELKQSKAGSQPKMENLIPDSFGEWTLIKDLPIIVADPQAQSMIDFIYNDTVSKTYINQDGVRIMLSIAYGAVQKRDLMVHFPQVCYPAQGFEILGENPSTVSVNNASVPVQEVKTRKGTRYENVTYWVRVGNSIVTTRFGQKLATIKHGIQGEIPDGLLFRISTIGEDYGVKDHEKFLNDLFANLNDEAKVFFLADTLTRF